MLISSVPLVASRWVLVYVSATFQYADTTITTAAMNVKTDRSFLGHVLERRSRFRLNTCIIGDGDVIVRSKVIHQRVHKMTISRNNCVTWRREGSHIVHH